MNRISKTVVAGLASLAMAAAVVLPATPAAAQWRGGWHGGGWHGGGWHGGGWGWHGGGWHGAWHGRPMTVARADGFHGGAHIHAH